MAEWKETGAGSLAGITRDTSTLVDARDEMQQLVEIIWRLRQPDGCPWDRKQTHASIAKNMIEEALRGGRLYRGGRRRPFARGTG